MSKKNLWLSLFASLILGGVIVYVAIYLRNEQALVASQSRILALLDGFRYREAQLHLMAEGPLFIQRNGLLASRVFRLANNPHQAKIVLGTKPSKQDQEEWDLQRVLLQLEGPQWQDQLEYALVVGSQNINHQGQIYEAIVRGSLARLNASEANQWVQAWKQLKGDIRCDLAEASLHEFTDHAEDALESLQKRALKLSPPSPEIEAWAGTLLFSLNKPSQAAWHLNRALEQLPDQPDWELTLAKTLDLLGQSEQALALLEKILATNPQNREAVAERGRQLLLAGKASLALADLAKVLEFDPGNVDAAEHYHRALFEVGDEAQAKQWAKKLEKMRTDQARLNAIFQMQLPLRPNDPDLMTEAAGIFLRGGQPKSALVWAKKALAIDPNHRVANSLLAGYYEATGNPGLAAIHKKFVPTPGGPK